MTDHRAPWNLDQNDDGEWVCFCSACNRDRLRAARVERQIDEWEDSRK